MMILLDELCSGWYDTPGSFSALMDLYECNYIQMRRLLPVIPPVPTIRVSQASGSPDLHLRIIERCRYTSELGLACWLHHEGGLSIAEPDVRIRVYHDARQAEVVAAHFQHPVLRPAHRADATHMGMAGLGQRWHLNRFLYKWLNYCLGQGHRFSDFSDLQV